MHQHGPVLSRSEVDQFIELGYLRVEQAIPGAVAQQCCDLAMKQLEIPLPSRRVSPATSICATPFLVHAASWPHRGSQPRLIRQPPIALGGALRLEDADQQLSPVALTVRRALDS